jgi:hypothetical protein
MCVFRVNSKQVSLGIVSDGSVRPFIGWSPSLFILYLSHHKPSRNKVEF